MWFYHIRKPRKKIWSIGIVLIKKINIFCYWHGVIYLLPGPTYSLFLMFGIRIADSLSQTQISHLATQTCTPLLVSSNTGLDFYLVHLKLLIYVNNVCNLAKIGSKLWLIIWSHVFYSRLFIAWHLSHFLYIIKVVCT